MFYVTSEGIIFMNDILLSNFNADQIGLLSFSEQGIIEYHVDKGVHQRFCRLDILKVVDFID